MKKTVLNRKKKKKNLPLLWEISFAEDIPIEKKINLEDIKEVAKEDFHSFIHHPFIHTISH